jgi:c-di-GMP-binding flagellar brake protein YcgR
VALKYSVWFAPKSAARRRGRGCDRLAVAEMIELRKNDSQERHQAFLRDVSLGGARIVTELELTAGERISLIVQLSEMASLEFYGRVVHTRQWSKGPQREYGIEYIQLHPADMTLLELFMSKRRRTETQPAS